MLDTFFTAIPMSYAAIFAVLNPLGSAMFFLTLTQGLDSDTHRFLSRRIAVNTILLLFAVVLFGSWILEFFGISIPIMQVGGGLIVAAISWQVITQTDDKSTTSGVIKTREEGLAKAFFPLTMPITAGPGSMAVTLTLSAHQFHGSMKESIFGELGLLIAIVMVAITTYFCYTYADKIAKKAGPTGTNVIVKISGFINFCISLTIIWRGIQGLFHLS